MTRWLRLWPTLLAATLLFAALIVAARPAPAPAPQVPPCATAVERTPWTGPPASPMGGVVVGLVPGQPKVFHHSDLDLVSSSAPPYPPEARDLGLRDARCLVRVLIDPTGGPIDAWASNCAPPFATVARDAVLEWRWAPPPTDGREAQTTVSVSFREVDAAMAR